MRGGFGGILGGGGLGFGEGLIGLGGGGLLFFERLLEVGEALGGFGLGGGGGGVGGAGEFVGASIEGLDRGVRVGL